MTTGLEIAIVGMACRYPGAANPREFWTNLRDGVDCVTRFTDDELRAAGVPRALLRDPDYVRARGVIDGHDLFDAEFFNIPPREAELMDPQHRLFLECAWEALEDSGYAGTRRPAATGVYAGAYENTYRRHVLSDPATVESAGWLLTHLSGERDYLATRTSYKLDLRGPALTVQTACSTSLVAVHLAGQALLSGDCELALAGGSTVRARQTEGYLFEPEGILSPDGHTRAFDADARGTVSSSGVGVVVLKRLEDAVRDRDTVYAVVRGTAVNNDGAAKVGFSAPSVTGQARAIRAAHLMAEVDPATIGYVEAHGSGTSLGDPIEIEGLTRAFRAAGSHPAGPRPIGSVKTNIGHTHAASGVAGLIKTALALRHRQIPPSIDYRKPNPDIDFARSPFHVVTELTDWKTDGTPRLAGVSSFGTGGTNAHAVLEEAPARPETPSRRPWRLLPLSAHTETALDTATDRLAAHLRDATAPLADVAYTLQVGRARFTHRQALVCADADDAAEALETRAPRRLLRQSSRPAGERPVAFMFSGLGDQYPGMARELYASEPVFRAEIDRCADLFRPHLGIDLRTLLHPDTAPAPATGGGLDLRAMLGRGTAPAAELDRTLYAQPAMFMVEWALARLWTDWGIRPQAMLGYSIGEYVAACVAGVLTLEDACLLVAARARLIEEMPGGAMLAVALPEHEASALDDRLSVAAVNGPALTVLAGTTDAVAALEERLTGDGVAARRLQTTHAFHSHMMEPGRAPLTELTRTVTLNPPTIPYLSNVTGTWITDEQATDPAYWARHMCETVRFAGAVEELWRSPGRILLEVGPGQAYSSLALQLLPEGADGDRMSLSSLPAAHDSTPAARFLLTSLARLWLAGVEPDWDRVHAGESPGRVPLPTYPFQRRRHWVDDTTAPGHTPRPERAEAASMARREDLATWFSVPSWTSTAPLDPVHDDDLAAEPRRWLLFLDDHGTGQRIAERLLRAGHDVTTVVRGEEFRRLAEGRFAVAPDRREDYDALLGALTAPPETVVHLWTVTGETPARPTAAHFDELQRRGFTSLLLLTQAWGARGDDAPLHLAVVSDGLRQVTDGDVVVPAKATVTGPVTVAPQEHPGLTAQSIDVAGGAPDVDRLLTELVRRPADPVVAHRGRGRWTPRWEPVRLEQPARPPARIRERGVYLITGGLGGIGLTLAEHLARTARARLVLIGRSPLPAREEWADLLAAQRNPGDSEDETVARIRKVVALEELGAEVLVLAAEVTDEERMRAAVTEATARFGPVHGVIHAAGVAGGGVMQLKRPEAADAVLAPKARGALVLDAVLGETPLDFLLLCSSTIAFSGGLGQVDYCAANAFLDAYAQHRSASGGPYTVSVNWDAWQEVGMAAKVVGRTPDPRALANPLLHTCLVDTPDLAIYAARFASPRDWLVDEHRMLGISVIPGTAYLEMARAAAADRGLGDAVRFEDVLFLAPVVLGDGQEREVRVVMEKTADAYRFSVVSADGERWSEHVTGRVLPLPDPDTRPLYSAPDLVARHALRDAGEVSHDGPMTFGPRSQCVERVWTGDGVALARLSVPERYGEEVAALGLHPFLLDIATGFASLYLEADYLMPLRYRAIDVLAPLPARIHSLLTHRGGQEGREGTRETLSFDVTLFDEDGHVLLKAEEFVMKRARALDTKLPALRDGRSDEVGAYAYPETRTDAERGDNAFLAHLETGIRPAEGATAFARLLARELSPQVVVATKDLAAIVTNVGALGTAAEEPAENRAPAPAHPRPALATAYVAPRDDVERALAELWQDQIGVAEVGVHDNFYELGGHSLLGIKLLARLRDTLHVQVALQSLFDNLTVAELAAVVAARLPRGTQQQNQQDGSLT
ncbi:SDR family NAD(P)-dependent oxidoreductase [Streptomyces roseirectus]|uniref:SDR family NAD(P)-dependent oxidoreductase n=1 Tax=Streptomyces roseirectus TaxID=2768066 RepID=A0A7H0IN70_9ACTN|nr:type I polyketide synthase [Streptomyces roseirectus]QNP74236.1 SDR family NAD(P)-dependent oxidoreductase [Streptomyces roseirectus]